MPATRARRLTAALTTTVLAATLAACATNDAPSTTPTEELHAAFAALDDTNTLAIRLTAHVPDAALDDIADDDPTGPTRDQLADILGGHITLTTSTVNGHPLAGQLTTPADPTAKPAVDVAVQVATASSDVADLRVVDGNLYLSVGGDLATAVKTAGVAEFAPPAWRPDLAPVLDALAAGTPITLSHDVLVSAGKDLEKLGRTTGPTQAPTLSPQQTAKLTADLLTALKASTDITEVDEDTRYRAVVKVRPLLADILTAADPYLPHDPNLPTPSDLTRKVRPDTTAEFTVTVADGTVTAVSLDLAQFLDRIDKAKLTAAGADLTFTATFATDAAPVTAPAGAVSADPLVTRVLAMLAAFAPAT